jgi:large subunit ribosomal protein L32
VEVLKLAAVPKNKRSKAKRNTKRNSFKLSVLSIVECPRCRAKKIAHRVCQACGYYDNKEIIQREKKTKEKSSEKTRESAKTRSKNTSKIKEQVKTAPAADQAGKGGKDIKDEAVNS